MSTGWKKGVCTRGHPRTRLLYAGMEHLLYPSSAAERGEGERESSASGRRDGRVRYPRFLDLLEGCVKY